MQDILLTNNDLTFEDGDFAIRESLLQDAKLILSTAPGHWKQFPALGVDLENFLNEDKEFFELKRLFKLHLKYDDKKLKSLKLENNQVIIDVDYR